MKIKNSIRKAPAGSDGFGPPDHAGASSRTAVRKGGSAFEDSALFQPIQLNGFSVGYGIPAG